jgi:hypothetical protein
LNFLGHALIATWKRPEPLFVLGSMLPDFASMTGSRLAPHAASGSPLGEGVAFHHATDDVFHASSVFLGLMQDAMDRLLAAGVGRGPARAIGHIGVELLIDGELLAQHAGLPDAFTSALEAAPELEPGVFRDPNGHLSYRLLHGRLSAHGAPHDYRNVEAVARRLERILSGRPRLALAKGDEIPVQQALGAIQAAVRPALPGLLDELRTALVR